MKLDLRQVQWLAALAVVLACAGCGERTAPTPSAEASATPAASAASAASAAASAPQPVATSFDIYGSLIGVKDGAAVTLHLRDADPNGDGPEQALLTEVRQGQLHLHGSVKQPSRAMLQIAGVFPVAELILENATFEMDPSGTGFIRGGPAHEAILGFRAEPATRLLNAQLVRMDKTRAQLGKDTQAVEALDARWDEDIDRLDHIEFDHQDQVLRSSAPAWTRAFLLAYSRDRTRWPAARRTALLDELAPELGEQSAVVQSARRFIGLMQGWEKGEAARQVGNAMIDIGGHTAAGKPQMLSEVVGANKLVLLDFWASWCRPCRDQFPQLHALREAYRAQGFEVFAVSIDEDDAAWRQALAEEKVAWPNVRNTDKSDSLYGITAVPSNFLIDHSGHIVSTNVHGKALDAAVQTWMAAAPTEPANTAPKP